MIGVYIRRVITTLSQHREVVVLQYIVLVVTVLQ